MQSPLPQLPTGSGEVPDRAFYLRESSTRRGIPTNVSNGCPVDGCKEFLKTCDWPALSRLVVTIALVIVVVRVPPRSVSTDLRKSGGTPSGNHSAKRYMSSPAGTRGRIVDRGFSKAIASFSSPLLTRGGLERSYSDHGPSRITQPRLCYRMGANAFRRRSRNK